MQSQSGEALRHTTLSIPGRFTGKLPSDLLPLYAFNGHETNLASNRNECTKEFPWRQSAAGA